MTSISKAFPGSRHAGRNPPLSVPRYVALIATLSLTATLSWMSAHVGRCRDEDAIGVDCTLLVGRGVREHLMFDEVVGKPVSAAYVRLLLPSTSSAKVRTDCMFSSGVGMHICRLLGRRSARPPKPSGVIAGSYPVEMRSGTWSTVRLRPRPAAAV
jgi:hypothetical protein